jgi:hypothetical protein
MAAMKKEKQERPSDPAFLSSSSYSQLWHDAVFAPCLPQTHLAAVMAPERHHE